MRDTQTRSLDSQIRAAEAALATSPSDRDAAARLGALLDRSGRGRDSWVLQLVADAKARMEETSFAADKLASARAAWIEWRLAKGGYCTDRNCYNGWVRWGDTDYPCGTCQRYSELARQGKLTMSRINPTQAGAEADKFYGARAEQVVPPYRAATDWLRQANKRLGEARCPARGVRVVLTSSRARPKWAPRSPQEGERVPQGTTGEVFWVGEDRGQGGRYGVPRFRGSSKRVGVRAENGGTFFTTFTNLSLAPGWLYDRWHGLDAPTAELEQNKAEDAALAWKPAHGDTATLNGTTGTVFWVGEGRNGRLRVGLRPADGDVVWGFAADAKPA